MLRIKSLRTGVDSTCSDKEVFSSNKEIEICPHLVPDVLCMVIKASLSINMNGPIVHLLDLNI